MLRALASQVIAWHHFAIYGPLPVAAATLAPRVFDLLDGYGRMAVQVFLVLGGFLAARALPAAPPPGVRAFGAFLLHRYRRTGLPAFVAVLLVVAATTLARRWIVDPVLLSAPPTLGQLAAHALLLQDLLEYEALAPGVWYLAIDLQLAALTLLLWWGGGLLAAALSRRRPGASGARVAHALCAGLAVGSLLLFNRQPGLDGWAVYFFASWFLGMVLQWALAREVPRAWFWGYLAAAALAGGWDSRPRLLVACATALALWGAHRVGVLERRAPGPIAFLGRISFSLFLTHFVVATLVNGGLHHLGLITPATALAALALSYPAALVLATAFHYAVEVPATSPPGPQPGRPGTLRRLRAALVARSVP